MNVELVEEGVAELVRDDGSAFPLPVLSSEVGILTDGTYRHYVPGKQQKEQRQRARRKVA